jgi:hypothetical protein
MLVGNQIDDGRRFIERFASDGWKNGSEYYRSENG